MPSLLLGSVTDVLHTSENLRSYLKRLSDESTPLLGHGLAAVVYLHPKLTDVVARVSLIDGTFNWISQYHRRLKTNPYFPRIYGQWKVKSKGGRPYGIILEELLDRKHYREVEKFCRSRGMDPSLLDEIDEISPQMWLTIRDTDHHWYEILQSLLKFSLKTDLPVDIGSQNMLWRGSTPVICDPFYHMNLPNIRDFI